MLGARTNISPGISATPSHGTVEQGNITLLVCLPLGAARTQPPRLTRLWWEVALQGMTPRALDVNSQPLNGINRPNLIMKLDRADIALCW